MKKIEHKFEDIVGFDHIDLEEKETLNRRVLAYSVDALKIALPIDKIVVEHTQFHGGLLALDRIFQLAREVNMPHGLRLIGPTGVGKSSLLQYFSESLPRSTLFAPGLGCISIRIGSRPKTGQIISALLRKYRYPFIPKSESNLCNYKEILFELVRLKGTRLIFIDEAHSLLCQARIGNESVEPEATGFLRELMDETNVALVLGGKEELDKLANADSHLADRISGRFVMSCFDASAEWVGFLCAFSDACTWFDIKLIKDPKQAKLLHTATGGSPRNLKRLLTEVVLVAAQAKCKSIQVEHFSAAYIAVNGKQSLNTNPYA